MAGRLFLQSVVAYRRRRAQSRFNITLFQQPTLLRILRPNPRETVRL